MPIEKDRLRGKLMAPNVRKGEEARAFILKADMDELSRYSVLVTVEAEKPDLTL